MALRRVALGLALLGVVLVPGPAYALAFDRLDGPERTRSSAGYSATPVDVENGSYLTDRWRGSVTFYAESLSRPYSDEFRAPNATYEVVRTAVAQGNATTTDPGVRADLREIESTHPFVTLEYEGVYDLRLATDGGTTVVRAEEANDSEIAAAVREELVVEYESLSPGERRTFRKIRNATTAEDEYAYRPWSDEPMFETPAIVEKDGEHYAVAVVSHTDDFGFPAGLFVGLAGSVVGVVSLLAAAAVASTRTSPGEENEPL